jgi:alkylhydroperoxidase family enzyme
MRRRPEVDRLIRAVTQSPGDTSPAQRQAIFTGEPVAGTLGDYIAMVRTASYRVTDADIERLRQAGLTEDAILEATIAAAVGTATDVLDCGLQALAGE